MAEGLQWARRHDFLALHGAWAACGVEALGLGFRRSAHGLVKAVEMPPYPRIRKSQCGCAANSPFLTSMKPSRHLTEFCREYERVPSKPQIESSSTAMDEQAKSVS